MASHCLTVCSTVAAEALHARIPTVLIGDFGAHDDYGMEYFYGSGLIKNFADIEFPFVLVPRQAWLERYLADTSAIAPDCVKDRKSPRLNSIPYCASRMPHSD